MHPSRPTSLLLCPAALSFRKKSVTRHRSLLRLPPFRPSKTNQNAVLNTACPLFALVAALLSWLCVPPFESPPRLCTGSPFTSLLHRLFGVSVTCYRSQEVCVTVGSFFVEPSKNFRPVAKSSIELRGSCVVAVSACVWRRVALPCSRNGIGHVIWCDVDKSNEVLISSDAQFGRLLWNLSDCEAILS